MSEPEFDTLWKEYMNAFAVLLIEAGGDPDTPAGRRLSRLVYEGGQLKGSMLVSYPDRIHYKLVRALTLCIPCLCIIYLCKPYVCYLFVQVSY